MKDHIKSIAVYFLASLSYLIMFTMPALAKGTEESCTATKPCITAVMVSKVRLYKKENGDFKEIGMIKKNKFRKLLKPKLLTMGIDKKQGISLLMVKHTEINSGSLVYLEQNAFTLSPEPKIDCDELGELTAEIQGSDVDQTTGVSTGHSSNSNKYCKEDK